MAPCEKNAHVETRPYQTHGGLKALLFAAPIAIAAVIAHFVAPKPLVMVASEAFANYCNADVLASNEDFATGDQSGSHAFFDTSWLPNFGDFAAVSSHRDKGQTFWNPLGMSWFTGEQWDLLNLAFQVGYEDGGESHAKFLQAVLMQETIAGQLGRLGHLSAPMGKRSYGVMQVKVTAARDVLRHKPELGHFRTDEQLIARLIADDTFNMRIASAYLNYLRKRFGSDHQALVAYNVGPSAAKNVVDPAQFKYVQRVELYMSKVVEPFNGKFPNETGRAAKKV